MFKPCQTLSAHVPSMNIGVSFYILFRDVDSTDTHRQRRLKRSRRLPRLTPNAAVKDTVCNLVFDQVWNESVTILQPLIALMRERACQGIYTKVQGLLM